VRAERRRGVVVGDLLGLGDVVPGAGGRLRGDVLADRGRGADLVEGDVGVLPLVPLVLQRTVRRGADDDHRDQDAHADDGEAAALLGALLLLADLVDDRLAVGLGGLGRLGHGLAFLAVEWAQGPPEGCRAGPAGESTD